MKAEVEDGIGEGYGGPPIVRYMSGRPRATFAAAWRGSFSAAEATSTTWSINTPKEQRR